MEQRDLIYKYLKELERYLARLEKAQAQEVLKEIESHIFDALEQQQSSDQVEDASTILRGFGEPRQLAFAYVAHITDGAPPPAGFKAIQKVKQGVTATLFYAMAVFGFSIAVALIFVAGAEVFMPDSVGVWSAGNGNSMAIGFLAKPYPAEQELLGAWLTPVAVVAALLVSLLTRQVLRQLKHQR
ncbi:hypothetical protein EMM73_04605 [Rheinheimera sediminis]|uniref:HAAS signaling domain-containing protein n=1 Tax=Rheinheimera sp. YQF-1 TaxID=2499626 RepID=UPI000FD71873|nr:hypothetical protein [Rheinheimera sp. YQF-1]RVT47562.1 hypothetical protein EMM73_04605 [Rheinheimera sp. YQF-1]